MKNTCYAEKAFRVNQLGFMKYLDELKRYLLMNLRFCEKSPQRTSKLLRLPV